MFAGLTPFLPCKQPPAPQLSFYQHSVPHAPCQGRVATSPLRDLFLLVPQSFTFCEEVLCLWASTPVADPAIWVVCLLSVAPLKGSAGFIVGTDWTAVNEEPFLSTRYTIQNLNSGDKIQVRVKAVSASGASVPATLEQPVLIREILRKYPSRRAEFPGALSVVQRNPTPSPEPERTLPSHMSQSSP